MQFFKFTLLLLIFSSLELQAQTIIPTSTKPFSIGETIEFHSTVLDENRTLNIYLPNGYSPDSLKKYPVIYLLDGSVDEDFMHVVGLVQFGSFSWIEMIPESIVVGIANVDRKRDFTFPTNNVKDKVDFPTTGGSERFIQFIESELEPFIESNYKTDSINAIIGQSLGGLLATEILFKRPDLFDNYIIVSPSLWWDDQSLLKLEPTNFTSNKSIFIGVGKEGTVMEKDAKKLYKKLDSLKRKNAKIYFEFFEKQSHADALHLAVYSAFEKIFKKEKVH